jgi:aromatic-L-amino-acid decarboxylase
MELMERLNRTGKIYLTHTKLGGAVALRMVIGQTNVGQRQVDDAWELVTTTTRSLAGKR